jgi:hypothetical protein
VAFRPLKNVFQMAGLQPRAFCMRLRNSHAGRMAGKSSGAKARRNLGLSQWPEGHCPLRYKNGVANPRRFGQGASCIGLLECTGTSFTL